MFYMCHFLHDFPNLGLNIQIYYEPSVIRKGATILEETIRNIHLFQTKAHLPQVSTWKTQNIKSYGGKEPTSGMQ